MNEELDSICDLTLPHREINESKYGSDRLSRNVDMELPFYTAKIPDERISQLESMLKEANVAYLCPLFLCLCRGTENYNENVKKTEVHSSTDVRT